MTITAITASGRLLQTITRPSIKQLVCCQPYIDNTQRSFSARRRQRRQKIQKSVVEKIKPPAAAALEAKPQKPWWRYITIWPDPHGYDPEFEKQQQGHPWPRGRRQWQDALTQTIAQYRYSHEGWLLSESKKPNEEDEQDDPQKASLSEIVEDQRQEISSNVAKNVDFIESEGKQAIQEVQKQTGIYTLQQLREWTALQLQLATECVQEFMVGYRKGRDDEIEKMMNTYFQEMIEEAEQEPSNKKKRRKPRRRIRTVA
jgi:hypothetical protein